MPKEDRHQMSEPVAWPVAMRFGTVLLACVLLALKSGHSLPPFAANLCQLFGLCGLAFYFCLELVAYHRDQNRALLLRYSAERRLSREPFLGQDRVNGVAAKTVDVRAMAQSQATFSFPIGHGDESLGCR